MAAMRTKLTTLAFVLSAMSPAAVAEPVFAPLHEVAAPVQISVTIHHVPARAKVWQSMSATERADIWPLLAPAMQRQYWYCMTQDERRELSERLHPLEREMIRSRFLIGMELYPARSVPSVSFLPRAPFGPHFLEQMLTNAEREELHRQLREFSLHYVSTVR